MSKKYTRRAFNKAGVATGAAAAIGLTASGAEKVGDANDRVRIGMIGVGNRGGQLLNAFLEHADAQIVAICDVFQTHLNKTAGRLDGKVDQYRDFRKLIDRPDIDAVVIATPDHWHAIQTITACHSGKDVYVEKPLSITIHEGRKMVEAARKNRRVVQVGTHRRSADLWIKAAKLVQSGAIGKVTSSRAARLSNMFPNGIGKLPPQAPPSELDWEMWLGPRPLQAYQDNIAPYKFRWWNLYSSQMGNWGVHYLDAIRWCLGEQNPSAVCAMGGRFAVDDDRTIPDTAEALFQFKSGHLASFCTFEASGNPLLPPGKELEIRGTDGTLTIGGNQIEIVPERGGQFQVRSPRTEPVSLKINERNASQTSAHARNFLDCIKSREKPNADIETGHRLTVMALLANISLATHSRLEWDPEQEKITNLAEANDLLHYEYRSPWTLDG